MMIYWTIVILASIQALTDRGASPQSRSTQRNNWQPMWLVTFFVLTALIGLRHKVGADWTNYDIQIDYAIGQAPSYILEVGDPAYTALNWVGANIFGGIYLVNTICAAIFSLGLISFCRAQPYPWLALVVAAPYLIIAVGMGYTRQGVAVGLAMLALTSLTNGRTSRFFFWIGVAATFHKSAVILVPLAIFASTKDRFLKFFGVILVGGTLFGLLLVESIDDLSYMYIEQEYESTGAAIRVAMNALPAAIFLRLRRDFYITPDQRRFWTWFSMMALGFVGLLMISPSSTAVDRVALYWIPLQLFVLSRLPFALGRQGQRNDFVIFSIILYSWSILFVWLFFSEHSSAWMPYQFYPWVLISS